MKKQLCITLSALLLTVGATAQISGSDNSGGVAAEAVAPKGWTLEACIAYALENNISLKQSQLAKDKSDEELKQSKAALFPTLSFATNQSVNWKPWSQSYVNLSSGTMTQTTSKTNYNGNYGLNASWTVWNGGRNFKNIKKSRLSSDIAEIAVEQTANTIQEQIVQYYVQILYQTEAVRVCEEVLAASRQQRDRAKEMVEVGSLARVDLAQLEAQVAQDEYNVVNAKAQLAGFKLDLKKILELTDSESFNIVVPTVDDNQIVTLIPPVDDVYQKALATRPEIRSSRLNMEASEVNLNIARRGYLPTISLNASVGSSNSSGLKTSFWEQMKTHMSNSVGLSLSIPIFDGRQNKTNIRTAKLSQEDSRLAMKEAEKTLYTTVENCHLDATSAQKQYLAAVKNEESMQESYNLVSEQFRLGLKNIIELTTGKTNLLQAKQTTLQSKYTALLNIAMLRFYQGEDMRL